MKTLHELFQHSVDRHPDNVALLDPARGASVSYGELDRSSDSIAADLARAGVETGDRVGILAPKSIGSVASILGVLKAGAAYVPVDATAPLGRGAGILADCGVAAVIVERDKVEDLGTALDRDLSRQELSMGEEMSGHDVDLEMVVAESGGDSPVEGLAYILYTSGSTGQPKGVMHTHASARCFVDWCSDTFEPHPGDRFSSHAPFHFDLSILDLYVPLAHGAAVVLIGEEEGKNPLRLGPLIAESGISVWYSTPSVLRLLLERGDLERQDAASPRLVLFAGEVFAPGHLRRLQGAWPDARYFNLYGPTETNVCTSYEVAEEVPPERVEPYPIGKPISGDHALVLDEEGDEVPPGTEGELLIHGGTVMAGYWNRPELNSRAFHGDEAGRSWYRTGDVVRLDEDDDFVFLGRRDRMIKRRGFRVELGEIEATLYRHPMVREAAVLVKSDSPEADGQVRAFVSWSDGKVGSTIALKRFCAENLPLYMVPDRFVFLEELPKTSTDKLDYVRMGGHDV